MSHSVETGNWFELCGTTLKPVTCCCWMFWLIGGLHIHFKPNMGNLWMFSPWFKFIAKWLRRYFSLTLNWSCFTCCWDSTVGEPGVGLTDVCLHFSFQLSLFCLNFTVTFLHIPLSGETQCCLCRLSQYLSSSVKFISNAKRKWGFETALTLIPFGACWHF